MARFVFATAATAPFAAVQAPRKTFGEHLRHIGSNLKKKWTRSGEAINRLERIEARKRSKQYDKSKALLGVFDRIHAHEATKRLAGPTKTAARAGMRLIQQAMGRGDMAAANRLARAPGVIKASPGGSQIRQLGKGSEGASTLVADPEHGIAARKLYAGGDSLSTDYAIKQKERAGIAMGKNPHTAEFYGARKAPGGAQMHFTEFVQGTPVKQPDFRIAKVDDPVRGIQADPAARAAAAGHQKAVRAAGFGGAADVRGANMIRQPDGNVKVVDSMPYRKGHMYSPGSKLRRQLIGKMPRDQVHASPAERPHAENVYTNPDMANFSAEGLLQRQLAPGRQYSPIRPVAQAPTGSPTVPARPQGIGAFDPTVPRKL